MIWFKDAIISGLQALIALRLKNAPAAETLEAVTKIWVATLANRPIAWDESLDRDRIRAGFMELAATRTHWPSPADFLASMPPRKAQLTIAPPIDNKMSTKTRELLDSLISRMKA